MYEYDTRVGALAGRKPEIRNLLGVRAVRDRRAGRHDSTTGQQLAQRIAARARS
jgi:hypothetical protein